MSNAKINKKDFYTLFYSDIKNILDNKVDKIIELVIIIKGKKIIKIKNKYYK